MVLVGFLAEKHFVSRISLFSNVIAINLFLVQMDVENTLTYLYANLGLFLGLIAIISYGTRDKLPSWVYLIFLAYCSAVVGVLIVIFTAYR
ncbi:energy-converting hydrogenase Eha subunit A [Methanococcus maripaludis]|uniref:Energy-converting hydrogenase Eha subunit A n=1 Tax=Methanococcus maripaludis TaxID=39152 RepID=A0A7J9P636_METMI|nr:hypothetical protein [Methanococcus maripaludis]MBA2858652.1 energy-converting hydrogenase Eha subunit A [Methanococcus maripaludis]